MSNVSVRLPEEIERKLDEEARISRKNRSELVREAVGEYLTRKQKERLVEAMKAAARVLYSDPGQIREGREIAEAGVEEWLEGIEAEERAAGVDPDERWWE